MNPAPTELGLIKIVYYNDRHKFLGEIQAAWLALLCQLYFFMSLLASPWSLLVNISEKFIYEDSRRGGVIDGGRSMTLGLTEN
ncbi:hypothetical protein SADUNF_Sadunf06G0050000 [Salix dunnii]|uniref:Uncharacterized protein n=1 Tax=Salix dunnii TaxID=1413687 RepID=A0A835K152_9ROSI|nr:hypothetical protein SADUNF_Sadunf06G0050000 [Salix dunnii]